LIAVVVAYHILEDIQVVDIQAVHNLVLGALLQVVRTLVVQTDMQDVHSLVAVVGIVVRIPEEADSLVGHLFHMEGLFLSFFHL